MGLASHTAARWRWTNNARSLLQCCTLWHITCLLWPPPALTKHWCYRCSQTGGQVTLLKKKKVQGGLQVISKLFSFFFFFFAFQEVTTLNFSTFTMHQHVYNVWERGVKKYKKIDWIGKREILRGSGRANSPTCEKTWLHSTGRPLLVTVYDETPFTCSSH